MLQNERNLSEIWWVWVNIGAQNRLPWDMATWTKCLRSLGGSILTHSKVFSRALCRESNRKLELSSIGQAASFWASVLKNRGQELASEADAKRFQKHPIKMLDRLDKLDRLSCLLSLPNHTGMCRRGIITSWAQGFLTGFGGWLWRHTQDPGDPVITPKDWTGSDGG